MFENRKFERELRKLQNKKKRNIAYYITKRDEARAKNEHELAREFDEEGSVEYQQILHDIQYMITQFLTSEAERLIVPPPPY